MTRIFVRKPEGNRALRRPRHRWKGNIRMDLQETGWQVVNWVHLAQDKGPVAGSYQHSNEHSSFIKHGEFLDKPRDY
jgi:hypothetical protein